MVCRLVYELSLCLCITLCDGKQKELERTLLHLFYKLRSISFSKITNVYDNCSYQLKGLKESQELFQLLNPSKLLIRKAWIQQCWMLYKHKWNWCSSACTDPVQYVTLSSLYIIVPPNWLHRILHNLKYRWVYDVDLEQVAIVVFFLFFCLYKGSSASGNFTLDPIPCAPLFLYYSRGISPTGFFPYGFLNV